MHVSLVDLRWEGHHTPYVVYLSQYLTEKGHKVTFITNGSNPRIEEIPKLDNLDINIVDFPEPASNSPNHLLGSIREQYTRYKQLRRIFDVVHEIKTDILHFLYYDRTQVPLRIASSLSNVELPPIVGTLHRDAFLDGTNRTLVDAATTEVTKWALHASLKEGSLDILTVHANSIRDRIIGAVPAATLENTKMIPAPTPEISVNSSPEEARDYLDLPRDDPIFLFFGGLRHEKGPDILAKSLQDVEKEITVIYAGSGVDFGKPDLERWKQRTPDSVTIKDRIEFIPEQEVDYYFVAADALVLPYRRKRGISGPLRRAAWVSTPIIGNSHSDIGRLIEDHNLGFTYESLDDLKTILASLDANDKEINRNALAEFAQTRHWSQTGDELTTIYDAIQD